MGDLFQNLQPKTSRFETVVWAAKLILLSVGIISTFILFKVAIIPYTFNLIFSMFSSLPRLWIFFRSWLSPPYIYILLNFIIISIAASSTFNHQNNQSNKSYSKKVASKISKRQSHSSEKYQSNQNNQNSAGNNQPHDDLWSEMIPDHDRQVQEENPTSSIEKATDPSPETASDNSLLEDFKDKATAVVEEHEEIIQDTLEDAWRSITERQARLLKKSDSWDTPPRVLLKAAKELTAGHDVHGEHEDDDDGDTDNKSDHIAWAKRELKKSETFSDRASLRRKKSMSQDELYRRSDAFIKKFNNDIRLQRLESQQRHMEMVNRGVN